MAGAGGAGRRPVEDITSVFNCYTEASIMARSYCNKSVARNQSRFISFAPDMVAGLEEEDNQASLDLLVGGQWQVHRVSPLWGVPFLRPGAPGAAAEEGVGSCPNVGRLVAGGEEGQAGYNRMGLARHARSIGEVVGRHAEVSLAPLAGLRGSRFDREALLVTVGSRMAGRRVDSFHGVLCGVEAEEVRLRAGTATCLPVLLTRGALDITERVIAGIERSFDCVVGRLELPALELRWMAAMWAGLGAEGPAGRGGVLADTTNTPRPASVSGAKETAGDGLLKLMFGLPAGLGPDIREQINHLTFEFPAEQIREVWRCCRVGGAGNELLEEEMEAFHRSLGEHVRSTLGVRLDRLELVQVQLPALKAHKGGRVAFGAAGRVKTVLRYLTELCQAGGVLEAAPTLAVTDGAEADTISMDYTVYREEA